MYKDIIKISGGEIFPENFNIDSISNIEQDTRNLSEGDMFVAVTGKRFDGNYFLPEAYKNGAAIALSSNKTLIPKDKPYILCKNVNKFLEDYAKYFFLNRKLPIIAIIGSVGKTTTKHFLQMMLPGTSFSTRRSFNSKESIFFESLSIKDHDFFIVEIGLLFLGEIQEIAEIVIPDYVLSSTICREHIEYTKTLENVINEQRNILKYTKVGVVGPEVITKNLPLSYKKKKLKTKKISEYFLREEIETAEFGIISLPFLRFHEEKITTILSILALMQLMEIDTRKAIETAAKLTPLNFRGNLLKTREYAIRDFSFNCQYESILSTIRSIKNPCIFVFGMIAELGEEKNKIHRMVLSKMEENTFIKKILLINLDEFASFSNKVEKFSLERLQKDIKKTPLIYFQGSRLNKLWEIICCMLNGFQEVAQNNFELLLV